MIKGFEFAFTQNVRVKVSLAQLKGIKEIIAMITKTAALPRRVRQKRVAAVTIVAVVTIVTGTFVITTYAGSQDNVIVSGFAALIFLPSFIAGMRLHWDQTAIFVCNVLMFVSLLFSAGSGPVFLLALIGVAVAWVLMILWSLDGFLFLYGLVWRRHGL